MDQDPSQRVMQYRSFVDVWHKCVPEIQFMTPRTDVCSICQGYRNKIKEAISEQDKLTLTSASQIISIKLRESANTTWIVVGVMYYLLFLLVQHIHVCTHIIPLILQSSCTYLIILARWDPCTSKLVEEFSCLEFVVIPTKSK